MTVHIFYIIYFIFSVMDYWIRLEVFRYCCVSLISLMQVVIGILPFVIYLLKCTILMHVVLDTVVSVGELNLFGFGYKTLGPWSLRFVGSICTWIYVGELVFREICYLFCCFFHIWNWILPTRTLKCVLIFDEITFGPAWSIMSFLFTVVFFFGLELWFNCFNILICCCRHYGLLKLSLLNRTVCKSQLFCRFWVWNNRRCISIWITALFCLAHLQLNLILLQLLYICNLTLLHLLQFSCIRATHFLFLATMSQNLLFLNICLIFCALYTFLDLIVIINGWFKLLKINLVFGCCMVYL